MSTHTNITHGRRQFHVGARVEVLYKGTWHPGIITDIKPHYRDYYDDVIVGTDDGIITCSNDGLVLREVK